MKLVIEFDLDADLIDVPQKVIDNREALRKQFLKWLYNKETKHKYWNTIIDSSGNKRVCLCYRGDAFVEWLNRKILTKNSEKATLIQSHINDYAVNLPTIYF